VSANSHQDAEAVFDAIDADSDRACALSFDAMTT
jgi:hypothetical protein